MEWNASVIAFATYLLLLCLAPHAMLLIFIPTVFGVRGGVGRDGAWPEPPPAWRGARGPPPTRLALPAWVEFPLALKPPIPWFCCEP